MTMLEAKISEVKSRLSAYLARVRRGETLTILDRKTPVARLVPIESEPMLSIRHPEPGAAKRLRRKSRVALTRKIDLDAVLREERAAR